MLEQLRLHNWQCHKDRIFRFGRITIIVGDNGAGKSSIVRALRWLAFNEWDGEANAHVTEGKEESEVELVFDGGSKVSRTKGPNHNSYLVNGRERKAFGKQVPSDMHALAISPSSFQSQRDNPFWITLTGGQAAIALNEIFSLETIDKSLSSIVSEIRLAKTREQVSKERLALLRGKKKSLTWTKQANTDLKKLEVLQEKISKIEEKQKQLGKIECLQLLADQGNAAIDAGEELLGIAQFLHETGQKIYSIKRLVDLEEKQKCLAKTLNTKSPQLKKLLQETCPLCGRGPKK